MSIPLLIKILILQAVVIVLIIFFLVQTLKRLLVEEGVRRFEALSEKEIPSDLDEIIITVYNDPSEKIIQRIKNAVQLKCKAGVKLNIQKQKSIKGGIIINLKVKTLDYSMANRLKESGLRS